MGVSKVSNCCPPAFHHQAQGGEGRGQEKSKGPRGGHDPAANDGRVDAYSLKSIVLSCFSSCPWLANTPTLHPLLLSLSLYLLFSPALS